MSSHTLKTISYIAVPLVLFAVYFAFLVPQASAKIIVEGDREFTDQVNECFNTYRNSPGVVGDVIRELESSENEHKIINGPEWTNTINDVDDAFNGKGTGTVTRVDSAALEKYKKKLNSLKHKDFCTGLLHEMWHAVDADRGEWSTDKIDGAKENEVEAVMFQNFIHGIRGVPPRTTYGRVDISEHVVFGNDYPEEKPKEVKPEPKAENKEPILTPTRVLKSSFVHVKPGEYSEIYGSIFVNPGQEITAELKGGGVIGSRIQTVVADDNGQARFVWKINQFGGYAINADIEATLYISSITVK